MIKSSVTVKTKEVKQSWNLLYKDKQHKVFEKQQDEKQQDVAKQQNVEKATKAPLRNNKSTLSVR